jgi:hypothetical protein
LKKSLSWLQRALLLAAFICLPLTGVLTAQVTVSGTGTGSGTNGFTITEGSAISGAGITPTSETLWADSTDGRLKVTNHSSSTAFDLALWPCRPTPGGIVVADTALTQNVYQETCPSTLKFVSPLLTVGAGGSTGQISLVGTTSGNVTLTPQAMAGTPTITFGTSSGTPAVATTGRRRLGKTTSPR